MAMKKGDMRPVVERNPRTEIGKLILMGYGMESIAPEVGLDYDTVRRKAKEIKERWVDDIKDVELLRATLHQMAANVYTKCMEETADLDPKNKAAFYRVAVTTVQAMLDISGLRQLKIDVSSSQFERLLKELATAKFPGGSGFVPALTASQKEAIDGEYKEIKSESNDSVPPQDERNPDGVGGMEADGGTEPGL